MVRPIGAECSCMSSGLARRMFQLQFVSPEHEAAIFAFERDNRAYFARSISDRGDSFFEQYSERHRELMAEQEAGTSAFYVLVNERGGVLGRFNLYDIVDGSARVGYRVAERVSGQGVATSGLRTLCRIARENLGLLALTAAASNENVAPQRVLLKAGFANVAPTEVGGRQGAWFEIDLVTI
jgi:ribosomal-protein-alanine N-acetyltransferase